MDFRANQYSGSVLVGAMTKLGKLPTEHHGVIIGEHNGQLYVAESGENGYGYVTVDEFVNRYKLNGKIEHHPNKGKFSGYEIAKRVVDEINSGGNGHYNLLFNNCESFVNRAVHGHSISWQSVKAVALIAFLGYCIYQRGKAA